MRERQGEELRQLLYMSRPKLHISNAPALPIGSIFMPLSRQLATGATVAWLPQLARLYQCVCVRVCVCLPRFRFSCSFNCSKFNCLVQVLPGCPCSHSWAQKPWKTFHVTDFLKANRLPPRCIQFSGPFQPTCQPSSCLQSIHSLTFIDTHSLLAFATFHYALHAIAIMCINCFPLGISTSWPHSYSIRRGACTSIYCV